MAKLIDGSIKAHYPVKNRKFGKYEVLQRLGRGGMAEVYRAYHPNLDRYVAIKVLHSFLSDDGEFRTRFEKEAQNIARLRHPNIVQVYDFDFDADSDSYFMVMELIDGPTLKDYLLDLPEGTTRLPLLEVGRIIREAAEALSYAHQRGMIHRDVKPANLMIDNTENHRVVLTDFGIARLLTGTQATVSGGLVGTPAYMSPEQGMGETGDERSDLYSLGIIMYQMLTGELPFDADTPMGLILQHMNDPVPSARSMDPHLPPAVDKVLQRLMAKDPGDRYQSAPALIADLDLLEKSPARLDPTTIVLPRLPVVSVDKPITLPRTPTEAHRFPIPLPLILLLAGLLVIAGGVYVVGASNNLFPSIFGIAQAGTVSATPEATTMLTDTPTEDPMLSGEQTGTAVAIEQAALRLTASPTATETATATATTSATATLVPPSATASPTDLPPTASPSKTAIRISTVSPATATATRTATPTASATRTPSPTATETIAVTATATPNLTQTAAADRTATIAACNFDYAIIAQTPDDGEAGGFFRINEPYTREIRLLNTGSCTWERLSSLTFLRGEDFSAGPRIFIEQPVEPAQEVTITFSGTLPPRGSVDPLTGTWELRTPGQIAIGEPFDISIMVFDPGS